jgi:hypothetical protein
LSTEIATADNRFQSDGEPEDEKRPHEVSYYYYSRAKCETTSWREEAEEGSQELLEPEFNPVWNGIFAR